MQLEPGYVFAGKYRIERLLGEGGMGAVYAAHHLDLGGRVALKVMLPEASSEASARFNREARASSQLRGEHIVRTLDAGKLTDGTPFIVLEYIDGVDVDVVLKERGPLPIKEAVEMIVQACEGVAEAHALGMVHRDLKLRNIAGGDAREGRRPRRRSSRRRPRRLSYRRRRRPSLRSPRSLLRLSRRFRSSSRRSSSSRSSSASVGSSSRGPGPRANRQPSRRARARTSRLLRRRPRRR